MDFLKKNYEKILLGVVLVGLVGVLVFLFFKIDQDKQNLQRASDSVLKPKVKELPPLDLQRYDALMKRFEAPAALDLSTTNKVFNPLRWQKSTADGHFIKMPTGSEAERVEIAKPVPLFLTITFDAVEQSDAGPRYRIGVERDAAPSPAARRKKQYSSLLGQKTDMFTVREVKGPPTEPTELILELNDTGELAHVPRDKPFKRVDGYMADLKYDPEKKNWAQRRVGAALRLGEEDYNIVAITENEVVLSAKSNNKKWTIRHNPEKAAP
jgi:hypothetical protein